MRIRCRLGVHDWTHFGYTGRRILWDGEYSHTEWSIWRRCTSCGKRRSSKTDRTPPDVTVFPKTGRYIDHSRRTETP